MEFIKDLPWASNLSERFRDAFEKFLPQWIESLLPYYQEGKELGVDLFSLQNTMDLGILSSSTDEYEKNGICYKLTKNQIIQLSFNGDKEYRKCNWLECFCDLTPDYDTTSMENIINYKYYNQAIARYFNIYPDYAELANRCDSYFKQITGDKTAGFSLGNTSFIHYNEKGLKYGNIHYLLD